MLPNSIKHISGESLVNNSPSKNDSIKYLLFICIKFGIGILIEDNFINANSSFFIFEKSIFGSLYIYFSFYVSIKKTN